MNLHLGLQKTIKHNLSKDKRLSLTESYLKAHTNSVHCNDAL
jgi:hypothetical protein